ncbi:PAAR domain-containing protein [Streptomyces celluloflavus]|uniref:PAAR domain-containing protein n=1 Tax=Streptomyces celluloflavus TaxID=58344 RepID=A0ABW7RK47_9ACTN
MPPAARVGDMHTCPMQTPAVPTPISHVGGPILPTGKVNVLIGNLPAAVVGNQCVCAAPAPDAILAGSATVLIGGLPAARQGDATTHGGTITIGLPTVMIGG